MAPQFACEGCGSASIVLPEAVHDDALIRCKGCARDLTTWRAFKERTRRIILAEQAGSEAALRRASSDPLFVAAEPSS